MSRQKDIDAGAVKNFVYDYSKASHVLDEMDLLRQHAVKTGIPEIVTMVDATYSLMVTSYYCIRRYEMDKLPGTDRAQVRGKTKN